jgi:hypothetical protein
MWAEDGRHTYLEIVQGKFACILDSPFGLIALLLTKSGSHLVDESPVQWLTVAHCA